MVNISNNSNQRVTVSTSNNNSVNASVTNSNDVNANTNGNAQLARSWAIGEGLIQNEDYSSKYYANKAKTSEEIVLDAESNINVSVKAAQEYAASAEESKELAKQYAQDSIFGMMWVEISSEDFEYVSQDKYTHTIDKPLAVAGVFKLNNGEKELVANADITVTSTTTTISLQDAIDCYLLATTAIITDEQDLSDIYDKQFTFSQAIADNTWVIEHNLNKVPSVTVIDSVGNIQLPEDIVIDSLNQITLVFLASFTGHAYLN